ncbi:MAG TPA: MopE-related protein [Myxococcota bacterium]|nr:MopE-related protein [Myxococcota bacterium]
MKTFTRPFAVACGIVMTLAVSCGGSDPISDIETPDISLPDTINPDVPRDTGTTDDSVRDQAEESSEPDTGTDSIADRFEPDVEPECPGSYGCPCNSAAECLSGMCVDTMDESVCSRHCSGSSPCPDGWTCTNVNQAGGDPVYGCVYSFPTLCRPCKADSECIPALGAGNRVFKCLTAGDTGSFCGAECLEGRKCPEGFRCEDQGTGEAAFSQCIPEGDECPCTDRFANSGFETNCFVTNEHGRCGGVRTCATECSAKDPGPESCNNIDDDCDGSTDEQVPAVECDITNTIGTCKGLTKCVAGNTSCDGAYATTEDCNNQDDDCDGITDDGFGQLTCGVGACAHSIDRCQNGQFVDCNPMDGSMPEVCDGIDNDCDGITDNGFMDTDQDLMADCIDDDDDDDGIPDDVDNCPTEDNFDQANIDNDDMGDLCDPDKDGDTIDNEVDNCPGLYNPEQTDRNENGIGDECESDLDTDGIMNIEDNCPWVPNHMQEDSDFDQIGDACDCDIDDDGIGNNGVDVDNNLCPAPSPVDNCPYYHNTDQANLDGDQYGDGCDCDKDGDGAANAAFGCGGTDADCAPMDPAVFPGAVERCNDIDDDCDASTDEGCDNDGDDYCDKDMVTVGNPAACPLGGSDCNDEDGAVNPGATETCNGIDDNCVGGIDNGLGSTTCGVGQCRHTVANCVGGETQTCDPMQGQTPEVCDNADNDCDGSTDEGCDDDDDGYCDRNMTISGSPSTCLLGGNDCNDDAMAVNPGATEVCNGVDDDCDGSKDEGLGTTTCGLGACRHTVENCVLGIPVDCDPMQGATPEACDGIDNDCDGDTDEGCDDDGDDYCDKDMATTGYPTVCPKGGNDCNDGNGAINPGATETCNDIDDNCSGAKDEGLGTTTCGQGVCNHTINNCVGGVTQFCNPFEGSGVEVCDGLDNDCDGAADEALGTITCGLGVCNHTIQACLGGAPQVCDPMQGATTEICDGLNNDCDSETDEGCDDDNDDYCDNSMGTSGNPSVCPNGGNDCDDNQFNVNPGKAESCNNVDDNCNNIVDDGITSAIDGYEANNSCQTALDLGTFEEDATARSFTATIYPSGDNDYYIGYFDEAGGIDCIPFTDQDYRVKITLTPPSGSNCVNYQIRIYDNSCNEKARTTQTGCAARTLTWDWDGACGGDDSATWRFAVIPNSTNDWECVGYTMTVEMDAI